VGIATDLPAAYSEANAAPPPPPLKPGILIVSLHEGRGFQLPAGAEEAFRGPAQHAGSLSSGGGFSVAGSMRPNSSSRNPVAGSYNPSGRPQSAAGSINAAPTIHGRYHSKYLPYALVDFDKQQVFINAVSGTPQDPFWAGENTQYKFDVSRTTDIHISLYIRNPNSPPNSGRNDDIFLGTFRVSPRFEEVQPYVEDPKLSKKDREKAAIARAEQDRELGQVGPQWIDVTYGSGQMRIGVQFVENRQRSLKIEDFELLKVVGKGSFGKVMQVQ
jgi:serum/glucocorticoid-regulated kinase 2